MYDNKQRTLIAFYIEYQKDKSNYNNLNLDVLKLDNEVFEQCKSKLEKEQLIECCLSDQNTLGIHYEPTLHGIDYIEKLFKISNFYPNIVKLECVGFGIQEEGDEDLINYTKSAMIEIDSCHEDYFKENKFKLKKTFGF